MTRILFVDDEQKILDGLQRMLHSRRGEWEMSFAPGSEAALRMLEAAGFDVIVSDMRMPGIDGAQLLRIVQEKYPNVLRIILSGYTELEASFRAVPVAHQFLLKPCNPDTLRTSIERGAHLVTILNSNMLISVVGSLKDLPSLPRTYAELRRALADPETSISHIVKVVEQDVAISAKVLQLVNSAFFGVTREIADIGTACSYLGISILQNLVLSAEAFRCFKTMKPIAGFSIDELHSHSHAVAQLAGSMPKKTILSGPAVVAGLLHDIGKLVMAERIPDHFARALECAKKDKIPLYVAEETLCGVSHAEVGAYLLSLWGIPYPIVEAVAHHHHPERLSHDDLDIPNVVYLANLLAHEHTSDSERSSTPSASIDPAVLANRDVEENLDDWRKLADKFSAAPAGTANAR